MGIRKVEEKALFVTRAVSLTVVVLVLVTLCVFAQSVLASQISVDPECQIVTNGTYFTVNITADPEGNETYAASFTLYFNNTLVNATSPPVNVTFLSQDGVSTWITRNETDNTNGTIEYGECRTGVYYGVTDNSTENRTLATITFEAIADGFCELGLGDLDAVILADPNGTAIPTDVNNGSVRIGICGDVTGDENVRMSDGWQIYSNLSYPGQYPIHLWAADVTNDTKVRMSDGWQIYSNLSYPGQYPLNCQCSG